VALVDWTEKKGLKCNFGKFGTVLQFIKESGPLKLKLNWTVLKIGIGHFCNKIWTESQFLKISGLKCNNNKIG